MERYLGRDLPHSTAAHSADHPKVQSTRSLACLRWKGRKRNARRDIVIGRRSYYTLFFAFLQNRSFVQQESSQRGWRVDGRTTKRARGENRFFNNYVKSAQCVLLLPLLLLLAHSTEPLRP